jgi:hypothetical protein
LNSSFVYDIICILYQLGGSGVLGQGHNGGYGCGDCCGGGGGGGAGTAGGVTNCFAKGGDGLQLNITGSLIWYAG